MLPERPRRVRRGRPATLCFDESRELLWECLYAHKPEHGSSDRVVLVIELYEAEMIRALEHVLVNFFCSRRAERIGKPPRVQSEAGKIRKGAKDQKRRRIDPRIIDRRSAFQNRRIVAESFLRGCFLIARHAPGWRKVVESAERNHAGNGDGGEFLLGQIALVESD